MKRYILQIIVISSLFLSGCADYLDKNPLDQISSSTFWKTKTDFDMALTANYGEMQAWNGLWSYELPVLDNITDNSYGQHNFENSKQIASGDVSPTTGGYLSNVYGSCYQGIARANIFLKELGTYKGTDFTDADKKRSEAEVRFLRAFYYFQLYSYYGDVPLVLEPLTLETQEQPKVAADKVFAQVVTDLDFAIANLNAIPYTQNTGHVVKSTALALKARVLIYVGYGNNGTPDINLLTQVKDLCLQVIPQYSLSPIFENLFQDKGQSTNPEIIFSINFLSPDNVAQWDLWYGDWIVVSPLQSFVNSFECSDGLPWGNSPLTNIGSPYENRDPRLSKTVFVDHPDWGAGNQHFPTNSRPTGFGLKKFLCPENTPYGYTTLSQQNAVVLRLGEVLLMYAEVQNEIAGPDSSVYKAMTDLRARVGMPPFPVGMSKVEMRERIRHERRIELAFEGLRYFDLKRWHIAGDVLNKVTDGLLPYKWDDKFYQWPLPQSEIDRNHGILIQNTDYK